MAKNFINSRDADIFDKDPVFVNILGLVNLSFYRLRHTGRDGGGNPHWEPTFRLPASRRYGDTQVKVRDSRSRLVENN